jgi:choline dehydrogenase-like flavoprotein
MPRATALDNYRVEEQLSGADVRADAEINRYIASTLATIRHPCGTWRIGTDGNAVLDPKMRVKGIAGLRVVDASGFPDLPGAHINAAVLMAAEKIAGSIVTAPNA